MRALKERPDGDILLAAALRAFFQWDRQRKIDMGKLDSVGELIQQRNEKLDKRDKRRRGDGDRKRSSRRDRDDRGRDDKRDKKRGTSKKADVSTDDLDALLLADEPKKKSKRRRKRKSKSEESPSKPASKKPVDDLDALLISDG